MTERRERIKRGAQLGGIVARTAVDGAVTGVAAAVSAGTRGDSPDTPGGAAGISGGAAGTPGDTAEERSAIRAANRLVTVLGNMRGAAMKLGQALATVDLGLVPEHAQPEFAARLAALTDRAPGADFATVRPIIEADCPRGAFAEIDPEPFAAASIGQVHRARTRDGRDVVVKVQYPDIDVILRADLKNLQLFLRMWRGRRADLLRADGVVTEIGSTLLEELDYARECATQTEVAAHFAGHPFILVPAPLPELSGPRVLVTEFCPGGRFTELEDAPRAQRDRAAEILHRFYAGGIFGDGRFCGDPHPGNVLVCPDGRLGFVDFGLYKRLTREQVAFEGGCFRAASDSRSDDLIELLRAAGAIPGTDPDPDELLAYFHAVGPWHLTDGPLEVTAATVRAAAAAVTRPPAADPPLRLPASHTLSRRAEMLAFGMIGRLRATADWHLICREWVCGDPPATELGRQHARWAATRTA
ncbi:AarF/ABC1/UbiB kinase family protein [Tsukamurella soli]|uniref:AarF/ABC1/UbiB kinase family protein n=1 Tax=Tsukamurella soli TaxID=644556 RepID=A0ABP8K9W5_9ACTN